MILSGVLVSLSASFFNCHHKGSLRDADQAEDHEHQKQYVRTGGAHSLMERQHQCAADDAAAHAAFPGCFIDFLKGLAFLVSAAEDELRQSAEHDQQHLHCQHLINGPDISLIGGIKDGA